MQASDARIGARLAPAERNSASAAITRASSNVAPAVALTA